MRRVASDQRRDGGQVLVVFALALTAIVAMTGLVLDGGSAFVQRRNMQNVADNAAMSAAYAYGMDGGGAGDLASRLGYAVVHVDPTTQVEDPEQDQDERDQGQRELDQGLATPVIGQSRAGASKTGHLRHPDLNAAAMEAVRQWEFDSTILNCTKVEVPMKVTVMFSPR